RLAAQLETATYAAERRERLDDVLERDLQLEPHGHGRERVERVVAAGNLELDRADALARGLDAEARAVREQLEPGAADLGLRARAVEDAAFRHLGQDGAHIVVIHA